MVLQWQVFSRMTVQALVHSKTICLSRLVLAPNSGKKGQKVKIDVKMGDPDYMRTVLTNFEAPQLKVNGPNLGRYSKSGQMSLYF